VGGAQASNGSVGVALVVRGEDIFFCAAFRETDDGWVEAVGDRHGNERGVVPQAGREEDVAPARSQDARHFLEDCVGVLDVLHHRAGIGEVHRGIVESGRCCVRLVDFDLRREVVSAKVDEVDSPEAGRVAYEEPEEGGGTATADFEQGVSGREPTTHLPLEDVVRVGVVAVDARPESVCEGGGVSHDAAMLVREG